MQRKVIIWFRNDLRLHDNVTLAMAGGDSQLVYPVFCFDPRWFEINVIGLPKSGSVRTQFLIETVTDLRENIRALGSELIIRVGTPEEVIPELTKNLGAVAVYASKSDVPDETEVETSLGNRLQELDVTFKLFSQSTLIHESDLPWPVEHLPEVFTKFRKEVEKTSAIREVAPFSNSLSLGLLEMDPGPLPTVEQLGLQPQPMDLRSVLPFRGGESVAKARLDHYFWEMDCLKEYKYTRNGMLGANYSSKFSPWLATGALSPRFVYSQIKAYETQRVKNSSTYWLKFELLWRDYFKFILKKYGNRLLGATGVKGRKIQFKDDQVLFEKWVQGQTGIPFIDANMRELQATGFMSNRGRQNVASFLVNDLKVNWTWGASYFESKLIDYDLAINWGNWNYLAGVGNDPRENRYFNIINQALRYDSQGDYVRHWIPELAQIMGKAVHYPNRLESQKFPGGTLSTKYPEPLVDFSKWI